MKNKYVAPTVELLKVKPSYTLLENFSAVGDIEEFEYGGEV